MLRSYVVVALPVFCNTIWNGSGVKGWAVWLFVSSDSVKLCWISSLSVVFTVARSLLNVVNDDWTALGVAAWERVTPSVVNVVASGARKASAPIKSAIAFRSATDWLR